MPVISNTQPAAIHNFNAAATVSAPQAVSAQDQLAAINAKYPNLQTDIEQARTDVESVQGSDSWDGLQWFEKAVFFLPPFGPLIGVMMLNANKDMIRNADQKLSELLNVAEHKGALESQIAASLPDRFVA